VIIKRDVIAVEYTRQFLAFERDAVDLDRRVAWPDEPFPHWSQLVVAVEEKGFHECLVRGGIFTSHKGRW